MMNTTESEICYLDEIIIEGKTLDGAKFRPSDWVDRLCGMLADFNQQKMAYSPYLRPMVYQGMNCVAIKKQLEETDSPVFKFLMQFANDNNLRVVDCAKFKEEISV